MIWDSLLLLSLSWVCLRLYQLSRIPREALEERLGYDSPPTPEISIAGIKSRSVLLCWLNSKNSGFAGATLTLVCNGIKLGEIHRGEDLVEIAPLHPSRSYSLRLQSINSGNVATESSTSRFQTLPAPQHTSENGVESPAKINANPFPPGPEANAQIQREINLISPSASKTSPGRKILVQSSTQVLEVSESNAASDSEEDGSLELMHSLTQRLEELKRHKEELQRQIEEEEADTRSGQSELLKGRDHLKHELKEKEDVSIEMKKQGNHLEKLNRAAQNRKLAREKVLLNKKAEKNKHLDAVRRWTAENMGMQAHIEAMDAEIKTAHGTHSGNLDDARFSLEAEQSLIRNLEEEIRVIGPQVKDLEQRNQLDISSAQSATAPERHNGDARQSRLQALHLQLQDLWNALNQSKLEEQHAEDRLCWFSERQASSPHDLLPSHQVDGSFQGARSRPFPSTGGHAPRSGGQNFPGNYFGLPGHSGGSTQLRQPSGNFTVLVPAREYTTESIDGPSRVPGGSLSYSGLMSPAANDLLPSDLLGDEDLVEKPWIMDDAGSAVAANFARHAITNSDASIRGLHTPVSTGSGNGSAVTSPHSSLHNVSSGNAENESLAGKQLGAKREQSQYIRSPPQGGSRIANLFSSPFGRPRGKTSGQQPPALGALKQGQSQSFPRNIDDEDADISGLRRRRGSHGAWGSPMAGLMGKVGAQSREIPARARAASSRGSRLNMFKSRMSLFEQGDFGNTEHTQSRPSSTYSYEPPLSRPSSENQSIWASTGESLMQRDGMANSKWNGLGGPWSRDISRRASIQHGSSTNLSLGSTPLISEAFERPLSKGRAEQAPIGTRPTLQRNPMQRLNPAAPSFKTLFGRSENRKALRAERAGVQQSAFSKTRESDRSDLDGSETQDEASPETSRVSRDAQSINTAASTADSYDSLDRSPSGATSDSPAPKESLMQKISRKSSSGKFNVPWSKERAKFSKRSGESAPQEADTDGQSDLHVINNQREEKSGRGWPSIRRKSRKEIDLIDHDSEMADDET